MKLPKWLRKRAETSKTRKKGTYTVTFYPTATPEKARSFTMKTKEQICVELIEEKYKDNDFFSAECTARVYSRRFNTDKFHTAIATGYWVDEK